MSADLDRFVRLADQAMVVVTTTSGTTSAGCLVGFHTQCSIDPWRYLVMLSKANHTYDVARHASRLAVQLLGPGQRDLATLFGAETDDDGADKLARCDWHGDHGAPVLADARAWFVGDVVDRFDVGDHQAITLTPTAAGADDGSHGDDVLRYHHVENLDPGHPA